MKRFLKFLISVVVVAGIHACTTDTTEDFGANIEGKTQFTLSLDGTRTNLTEFSGAKFLSSEDAIDYGNYGEAD